MLRQKHEHGDEVGRCDQRQAGDAQEHSWLSLLACHEQRSDAQGRKLFSCEETSLKYIYITILASEYANCTPLGRRNREVCTGDCPVHAAGLLELLWGGPLPPTGGSIIVVSSKPALSLYRPAPVARRYLLMYA